MTPGLTAEAMDAAAERARCDLRDYRQRQVERTAWIRLAGACGLEGLVEMNGSPALGSRVRILGQTRRRRCDELLDLRELGVTTLARALVWLEGAPLACGCSSRGSCGRKAGRAVLRQVARLVEQRSEV